ncbi:hypothetical protein BGX29_002345, partial [Mortierella sp. GBA35]
LARCHWTHYFGNVEPGHLLEILLMAGIVKTVTTFATSNEESLLATEPHIAAYTECSLEGSNPRMRLH